MSKHLELKNKTAIVTGAASGIGRAIAISLANRGCNLALTDIDNKGLEETTRLIASNEIKVSCHNLDVSNEHAVKSFPDEVLGDHSGIDVLVNNAGVSAAGQFEQTSEEDFEWVINVNFWGVVRMTRAFLPVLRNSKDAHLCNISSIFGIIAPPEHTAYVASKFAVRGFSQSLRHELLDSNIGVTVVHPGGVATSIAENTRAPAGIPQDVIEERLKLAKKKLVLSPAIAGETIVKAIEKRKARVLVGSDAKVAALIERLKPVYYWNLMSRLVQGRESK